MDRTINYQVGDDNNFDFMPVLTTIVYDINNPSDFDTVEDFWQF